MDSSISVGDYWKQEKTFVKNVTRKFDILPNGARVSIITFDDEAKLEIKFSDYKTNGEFETELNRIPHMNGYTNIALALETALNKMFLAQNGMRPASPRLAILITDGKNNRGGNFAHFRNNFQFRRIKILVVGVGDVEEGELRRLVESQDDDYFYVTDFSKLDVNDFIKNTTFCKYREFL